MPDVSEGLTSDVDSDAGFMAALAEQAGVEVPEGRLESLATEDRSIAAGLAAGLDSGQPRDEGGRFAPAATESGEGTPAEGPAEGQPAEGEPEVDPAVTALLEAHGGDANAALAALARERDNAQSLIGRQGQELGELRNAQARMEGQLEALLAGAASPAEPLTPVVTNETLEGLESMAEERGSRAMMEWVIDNRPDLIDHAIEVWHADDPLAAQRFAVKYDRNLESATQEPPQQAAPQSDPFIEGLRQEAIFTQSVDRARASLGIAEQEWPSIRDHVIPAFEDAGTSPLIKNAIVSDDETQRHQGMEALLQLARNRAISAAGAEATAQASDTAAAAAAARKQAAQVVTGSLRPVERQPGEEMTSEERVAAFHKRLLGTETTSVEEGLRQGAVK